MRNNRKMFVGLVAAAALAASASFVQAQPQGGGPGYGPGNCAQAGSCPQGAGPGARGFGPGMMERGGSSHHGGFGPGHMWSNPQAAVAGYLASLKVELKIAPDQEKAWHAFEGKAKAQADTMIARRAKFAEQSKSGDKTLSAPELLAQRTEHMKQALASMETMSAAVKDLYAALTPEQKTLADRQLARGPGTPECTGKKNRDLAVPVLLLAHRFLIRNRGDGSARHVRRVSRRSRPSGRARVADRRALFARG